MSEVPEPDRTPLPRVLEVNAEAWRFLTAPRRADSGRLFLARRGIDVWDLEAAVGQPLIGHTADQPAALTAQLRRLGFTADEVVDSGWAVRRDGTLHERFRRRALVPVRDADSHIVGVIGRDVTDRARRKYLNTAKTVAFSKGSLLYRPSLVAPVAEATIVVCEGTLDALAVAAAAEKSAHAGLIVPVALSGTAMTSEQAHLILTMSNRRPIMWPDGDAAGRAAAQKWGMAFISAGREANLLKLPDGHDPASWLKENGVADTELLVKLRQASIHETHRYRSRAIERPLPQSPSPQICL
jgi:DNA primase